MLLKFSPANAKTKRLYQIPGLQKYLQNGRKVYSLDLLSGWTCPGAKDCKAKVIVDKLGKRKVQDGRDTQFRCFSASQEALLTPVYNARKHNMGLIKGVKTVKEIRDLIEWSMPTNLGILRWHVAGDFFKQNYLEAAYQVAMANPTRLFYTYTKSLKYLANLPCLNLRKGIILPNFLITASLGGKYDYMIPTLKVRTAKVVFSESATKLPIDHTDEYASRLGGNFALLLHSSQPAKTPAAEAWQKIRTTVGGYSR